MVNLFSKRNILISLIFIISLGVASCTGGKSAVNTTWSLAKLVSVGDPVENSTTEIIEIKNCGVPIEKTTSCSAGTSNDLSVSLTSGGAFGAGAQFVIEGNVGTTLGIGQESGESVTLPTPPDGYIHTYTVVKTYKIVTGQVLAHSSDGDEQSVDFNFHASCSVNIVDKEQTICSGYDSPPINQPPATDLQPLAPPQNREPQFDPDNPEGFLKWYFHEVWDSRNYENLWTYLSDDFTQRRNLTYSAYKENWNKIGSIEEPIEISYEGKDSGYLSYRVQYTTLSLIGNYPDHRNDLFKLYFSQDKDHWEFK